MLNIVILHTPDTRFVKSFIFVHIVYSFLYIHLIICKYFVLKFILYFTFVDPMVFM